MTIGDRGRRLKFLSVDFVTALSVEECQEHLRRYAETSGQRVHLQEDGSFALRQSVGGDGPLTVALWGTLEAVPRGTWVWGTVIETARAARGLVGLSPGTPRRGAGRVFPGGGSARRVDDGRCHVAAGDRPGPAGRPPVVATTSVRHADGQLGLRDAVRRPAARMSALHLGGEWRELRSDPRKSSRDMLYCARLLNKVVE
ncbi:MAG: hypothetical protein KatS3mg051_1608 [Anaerolineae bacterium]|nr:MAG: hypothetical protein KatS3mg051_1608 [Anaerolineae bacterium]